ncbi:MAG: GPW/gp25 family protein [Anaerolineae bacterium]|nr:GPW/gp25 family protein [Anaerolineae bacterium]MDW8099650.1 GPW/gp25 family protein [Anaerolineae bacterium]
MPQEYLASDLSVYRAYLGGERERGSPDLRAVPGHVVPPDRTPQRDLANVDRIDNLRQALVNRLLARRGELADLGHPGYGSRLYELIGRPNSATQRNLAKLFVLEALSQEPRVDSKQIQVDVQPDPRDRNRVLIEIRVRPVGEDSPVALQVPFSFTG